MIVPNQRLQNLRSHFVSKGFNLWFVGGCVRDTILGIEPKDVDLCTDATPEEQLDIYKSNNIRHFETGIKHGTITVALRVQPKILLPNGNRSSFESYEITSLRTETEHDGRHAVVAYTRDLNEDLSRRDLTINAMAQDFDGNIIDPFDGMSDLKNERVRMVGDANERFVEDYLRILRFFRFHARFAGLRPLDSEAEEAIIQTKDRLVDISGERIWQEMKKILVGPYAASILVKMYKLGVLQSIQLKRIEPFNVFRATVRGLTRPASVLGIAVHKNSELEETMSRWRMSNNERAEARFAHNARTCKYIDEFKEKLVDGAEIEWVEEMVKYAELPSLRDWDVPVFPVDGLDLINRKNIKTGPAIGIALRGLRQKWKDSNYTLTKQQLLGGM